MALTIVESSSSSFPYSSSSTPRSSTYHVFLSFRGEDTRKGFTDHLCAALERKGITTFRDDKYLERGQVISQELLKAIEESMFAITILSQDYASSTWCLDELQKIMECNNNRGLEVLPVFYGVDPSDVRHQRGSYKKAFRKHKERFGQDRERVKKWRDALKQVASHSGWDSKNQHEAELVESIAQLIHKKLIPKLPSCTENLVGIASRVEEVNNLIGKGLNDVRFIGIWGMGGIGKTTIANAVFEAIRGEFQVTCFLANVREVFKTNGLVHLQRELLSHLSISKNDFHNLNDGKKTILNSLCRKKVLLVLDDVNDVNQLENLAGKQDWFGPGSRVIVTTRDMRVLITHGIHKTYDVVKLFQNEALDLFCLKAFKGNQPQEEYLDLAKEVVDYCDGLPLALEVLGSYLYRRHIDVWHSAVKKLRSMPHQQIEDKLMISYEGLDSMEKNIFLDIACFFKGMSRNKVIDILENFGYFPKIVIDILVERSLITLDPKGNKVGMHDLLQQMGRHIVFKESPNDPSRRSRLWSQEDISYVLTNNKGTEKINSICWNLLERCEYEAWWNTKYGAHGSFEDEEPWTWGTQYESHWSTEAFSNMSQLKFLSLYRMQLPLGLNCFPCSLVVLHWRGCSLKTLPLASHMDEVVDIDLSLSKIQQLWQGKQFMEKLKYLNLTYSENLKRFPDISGAPNLEKVILKGCTSLTKIHPSLVSHKKIVLLNLEDCWSLKSLPGKLEMSSLKILNISRCVRLCRLPDGLKELKCLEELYINDTAIVELPSLICHVNNLKVLSFSGCNGPLTKPKGWFFGQTFPSIRTGLRFPPSVWTLHSLRYLNLSKCNLSEESIPDYFCQLPSLVSLDLSGNNFVRIPSNISELPMLEILSLNGCKYLTMLPKLPSSIRQLDASECDSLQISNFNPAQPCSLLASHQQLSFSKEFESITKGHSLPTARFDMVIPGNEIPSWFVPQKTVSCAKIQVPNNCPVDELVGFTLCFLLESCVVPPKMCKHKTDCYLFAPNGKKLINTRILPPMAPTFYPPIDPYPHIYILYLSIDQFRDQIHKDGCWSDIEFALEINCSHHLEIVKCGSRLVCKQDVEEWNKVVTGESIQKE